MKDTLPSSGLVRHPLVWAVLAFILVMTLYGRDQHWPFWYQFDEESKGMQVISGERNLHHPLMAVNATALAFDLRGGGDRLQVAVETGRLCGAAALAVAVSALTWLACRLAGPIAGGLTMISLALHPAMVFSAHKFKEDPFLLAGWSLLLVAGHSMACKPGLATAVTTGLTAGLCASGKHIGWWPALAGVVFVAWCSRYDTGSFRWKRMFAYLGAMVIVWSFINVQMVADPLRAFARLKHEIEHQLFNDTGNSLWTLYREQAGWGGLAGLLVYLLVRLRAIRAWPPVEVFAIVVAGVYFVSLFGISRLVDRYLLPVLITQGFLSAVGLGVLIRKAPGDVPRRWMAYAVVLLLAVATLGPTVRDGARRLVAYAGPDTRAAMAHYIDRSLPTNAVVAYDILVNLPDASRSQRTIDGFAPRQSILLVGIWPKEQGPMLEWLRNAGVTYFVTVPRYVELYLSMPHDTDFGQFRDAALRQPFYKQLYATCPLIHAETNSLDQAVTPELRLYQLTGP